MTSLFFTKYHEVVPSVTIADLIAICQQSGEGIVNYIHRFDETTTDCQEHTIETHIVDICVTGMERCYHYVLENLEIKSFAELEAKSRRTSMSAPGDHQDKDQQWKQNTRMHQVCAVTIDQRR
ncbi:hypothetical protein BVC80_8631g9 [Macleaya cordata]|uniref:Uncharacterized protein n=1 Tax=Macleaya cordata TaxID=56857 RepID=A0A200R9E8_MACCD|nr:hypothetical protein BVC80_8631g9 [Macleaya cordata]